MQTSCGWFFDDVAGVEATLVMRYAGRAIDLAGTLGPRLEDDFLQRLEVARSNVEREGTAADVYRRTVLGRPVSFARVAATGVLLDRLGEHASLPGYEIELPAAEEHLVVGVVESCTGARDEVPVRATPHGAAPSAEVNGQRYGVRDLFRVQRARVMQRVAAQAARAVGEARHDALGHVRTVMDPLIARDPSLPIELALLLGEEEAARLTALVQDEATALPSLAEEVQALRARGVNIPAQPLAHALAARLLAAVERLPAGAGDAVDVLDLAEIAGVVLDLAEAQVAVARWWQRTRPATRSQPLEDLRERLGLSPELT